MVEKLKLRQNNRDAMIEVIHGAKSILGMLGAVRCNSAASPASASLVPATRRLTRWRRFTVQLESLLQHLRTASGTVRRQLHGQALPLDGVALVVFLPFLLPAKRCTILRVFLLLMIGLLKRRSKNEEILTTIAVSKYGVATAPFGQPPCIKTRRQVPDRQCDRSPARSGGAEVRRSY